MGDTAILVTVGTPDAVVSLAGAVGRRVASGEAAWSAVEDVVPGVDSVLVVRDPEQGDPPDVADMLRALARTSGAGDVPEGDGAPSSRVVEIPVTLDGPDLAEAARTCTMTETAFAGQLAGATLRVALVGFTPGFAYLRGLPAPLDRIARRATPRPVVPAGSVAIGGGFAGIYPSATPGGWNLVGRTAFGLFDPGVAPFSTLHLGDRVRLVEVPDAGWPVPRQERAPLRHCGHRPVAVEDPGPLTTVQDAGRRGVAHLGVPRAGAADPDSRCLANRLLGNPDDAAVLEMTARGPTLCFGTDALVAAVGPATVEIDDRQLGAGSVVPVSAGQRLRVGALAGQSRGVLGVAGGFEVPALFGSRSSDVLCHLGAGPLRHGDELGLGVAGRARGQLLPAEQRHPALSSGGPERPGSPRTTVLRVIAGPDLLPGEVLRALQETAFAVSPASNRVGVRLEPDGPPILAHGHATPEGAASKGMVTGAVQVPPDGCPVVLLCDHATIGGYPVPAAVISSDWGTLARAAPGDRVRFAVVSLDDAASARRRAESDRISRVRGWFPLQAG